MEQIYISCDMERIPGICSNRNREMGDIFYPCERKMMTRGLDTITKLFIKKEDLRNDQILEEV